MERQVTISNEQGLHARPAALLVQRMKELDARTTILVGEKAANASSIMSVLALGASNGNVATIEATGPDAAKAIAAVEQILTTSEAAG